jgi:hypothetical protein
MNNPELDAMAARIYKQEAASAPSTYSTVIRRSVRTDVQHRIGSVVSISAPLRDLCILWQLSEGAEITFAQAALY